MELLRKNKSSRANSGASDGADDGGKRNLPFLKGSFVAGTVALLFLTVGYQVALFVHGASVARIASNRDAPDTVWVSEPLGQEKMPSASDIASSGSGPVSEGGGSVERNSMSVVERHSGAKTPVASRVRERVGRQNVESFRFNPNTVSVEDLQRLGFSPKQAASIENYRLKGGRFRRKSDFAKSYVVSDSVYRRLEPYIVIPSLDLNLADSAAFDSLPGIGGYFAAKMVSYRSRLGGYSCKEQLMDIYNFDRDKYDALADLVDVNPKYVRPYPLWTLPADSLARHPYIASYAVAKGIVMYRDHNPKNVWTISGLYGAGVISDSQYRSLSMIFIEDVI